MTELTVEQRLDRLEKYSIGKCWRCGEVIHLSYSNTIEKPSGGEVLLCHRCYEGYCSARSDGEEELYKKAQYYLEEERNKHIKWL